MKCNHICGATPTGEPKVCQADLEVTGETRNQVVLLCPSENIIIRLSKADYQQQEATTEPAEEPTVEEATTEPAEEPTVEEATTEPTEETAIEEAE